MRLGGGIKVDLGGFVPQAVGGASGAEVASRSTPGDGALLRRYAADWRSVLDGTSIGLLQLMDPPLGTAVAAQSGFFDDPYTRIFRSIPQIWATVLAPDADERGRRIRDLHRDIRGVADGRRYSALDPETFWWAHATFTHLLLGSVERYHPAGDLDEDGYEHLYADTVAWYGRYAVPVRSVPSTLAGFRSRFDRWCAERLQLTPAVQRLLDDEDLQAPPNPFTDSPIGRFTTPVLVRWGRTRTIGGLPPAVRERFDLPWTPDDQAAHDRGTAVLRAAFQAVAPAVNRSTFELWLRRTGARTRAQRYVPEPRTA